MTIDKQALLAALMPQTETLEVEGFGTVRLRQISVAETDAIRAKSKDETDASLFGLRLIVAAVVDDAGAPVFTDVDVQALRATAGVKIDAIGKRVLEQNGFTGKNAAG